MNRYVHVVYMMFLSGVFSGLMVDRATPYRTKKDLHKAERAKRIGTEHADERTGGEYKITHAESFAIADCPQGILERHDI